MSVKYVYVWYMFISRFLVIREEWQKREETNMNGVFWARMNIVASTEIFTGEKLCNRDTVICMNARHVDSLWPKLLMT